jgi:signal transduction histidine kinase
MEILNKRKLTEKELQKKLKELEESKTALMNILEDVEEAEKQATEERDKTEAIITNLTDGLLFFNKENKLSLLNPQALVFFDIKAEKIMGKSVSELKSYPNIAPLINLLNTNVKKDSRQEISLRENLNLEVSIIPLIQDSGRGNLIVLHDVTREKIVEKLKTEFVSLAAHQLRTPLTEIKWVLKMFLDGDLKEINDEQKEYIKKTYRANERMINLINDLLDVSRIEEGKYLYEPKPANIEDIIEPVIKSLRKEIKRKRLIFEFQKPKEKLPQIWIDAEKIEIVIQNLVENAVRYTKMGGGVTIALKSKGEKIEFSIQDTGVGIPREQQNRIFTKFFRAPDVVKMETEGTGLGLFISKNIIEAHKGKIWFESEEGKGSTFSFTLPIKSDKI